MWITAALLMFVGGTGARVYYLRWRRRVVEARRVVEEPNSHFSSELVRQRESRSRWHRIDLTRVHPLNREEVERLLAIADHVRMGALSPKDHLFLDNMSDGRSTGGSRRTGHRRTATPAKDSAP